VRATPRRSPIDSADALGTRPIGRLLWYACSQTTLSIGVYGVYALSNAWFVARGVGEEALAAVNLVAPVLLLLGAISTTVGVGGASLVSRALGAGRPDAAARAASASFLIFWAVALLVTVVGLAAIDPLLGLLGATDATFADAHDYAVVILAGSVLATGFSAIVRAEGRMLFSTLLWVIPVLVQLTLDPLLIFGAGMGVTGAALGTVGGQAVSAGMALWFFFAQRDRPYRIGIAALRPDPRVSAAVLAIGAPSFLAGFGATVLVVLVNANLAALAAGAGVPLAAYAVASRVQTFLSMPQLGITQGVQPIVGYNAGRGLTGRVARTLTLSLRATVLYGIAAAAIVLLAAPVVVGWFVSEPDTVAVSTTALRLVAIGLVFSGVPPLVSGFFQALGRARPSYLISIGTLVAIKIPLVAVLGIWSPLGIWVALPLGELLAAMTALVVLRHGTREDRRDDR